MVRPRVLGASPSGGDEQVPAGLAWDCELCPFSCPLFQAGNWASPGQGGTRAKGRELRLAPPRTPLGSRTDRRAARQENSGPRGSRAGSDPSPRASHARRRQRRARKANAPRSRTGTDWRASPG
jgi:hypothetical protein